MTEQEAIGQFQERLAIEEYRQQIPEYYEAIEFAVKSLEEVQQYRAIGTPEECRAAVDKQTAKKPCKENTIWHCPECGEEIYWDTDYGQQKFRYCPDCGKKLNWSDEQ